MDYLYGVMAMGLFIGMVFFFIRSMSNSVPASATPAAPRVNNGSLYILPEWRLALLNLLRRIRSDDDPLVALENAMTFIEQGVWLPIHAPLPDIGNVTVREPEPNPVPPTVPVEVAPPPMVAQPEPPHTSTPPIPAVPPVVSTVTPMVMDTPIVSTPINPIPERVPNPPAGRLEATPPPPTPQRQAPPPKSPPLFTLPSLPSIEMPDNITLLLYLGAALVVIAAGVFVGGSWEAISGIARFTMVLGFALGFGWTGELFVRFTEKLKQAGQTFRTVGTILLPFAALAYERFVLNGNAPAAYWVVVGLGLAGTNYLLYRFSQKGRLTAYLAVFSLGVFALSLPNALKWGDGWFTAMMWFFAVGLFGIVWRLEPDGMALLRDFLRRGNDGIAESHFVLALLLMATGFFYWAQVQGSWNEAVTWAALTIVLVELALYYRAGWVVGIAALMAGVSALHAGAAIAPTMAGAPTVSLLVLAAGLMALAPLVPKRLGRGKVILTSVVLFWGVVARLFPGADYLDWVQMVAIVGYVGLPLVAAFRYRNFLMWSGVWVAVNLAVMDALSLFPYQPRILIPTLLYVVVAGLWLLAEFRPPFAHLRRYARTFFVAQASSITVALVFLMMSFSPYLDVALASAWGLSLLTLGWVWLTKRTQNEAAASATALEGLLALIAILYYFQLPNHWISVAWVTVGAVLLALDGVLPAYARRVVRTMALFITAIAPWTGILESIVFPSLESAEGFTTYTAQGVLGVSTLLYLWQTMRTRSELLTYATTFFAYVLTVWLSNDYLTPTLFAPALLVLGMGILVAGQFAPTSARYLLGIVGYSTVALAPFLGGTWASRIQEVIPFAGLTFEAWLQLTLAGAVTVYGTGTVRRQSIMLVYGTAILAYILVPWLGLDYLPGVWLPLLVLGLGGLTLLLTRYAPSMSKPIIEALGYGTTLLAPFAGAILTYFSLNALQVPWLTLTESMQLTLFGATLVYIEGAVRQREALLTYVATLLVYGLVGWLSYDYLPSALFAPILLGLGVSTMVVARYIQGDIQNTLELLGYGVVLGASFVGGGLAWWMDEGSQWLSLNIAQWTQLTLAGSALTYAIESHRRQSESLTYITSTLISLLMAWFSYDYLPPALFAPLLLVAGIATIRVARYTPKGAPRTLTLLGYGMVMAAPFAGWVSAHLVDGSSHWLTLDITQWAQLTLAGSAISYGIATATRRSEVFAYITTGLTYILVAWLSYDYLPSALFSPILLATGIVTLWVAKYTPQNAPKVLERVGYGMVLMAPFVGEFLANLINAESLWFTLNNTQWAQLTLMGSAVTYGVLTALRRSEMLTYITTALTFYLVGWLSYDYLPAASFAPMMLLMGFTTLLVARYTPAGAPKTLELLGYGVVLAAPFAGWLLGGIVDADSRWFALTLTEWVQLTLAGTTLTYGIETVRRQSAEFTYLTTALTYLLVVWLTLDYLPATWQTFMAIGMGVLTLAVAPVAPHKARQMLEWLGYGVVLLSPFTEMLLGNFAEGGNMSGVIGRAQFATLLAAVTYGGLGWYRRKRELVAIGGVLLYAFYAWVAMDRGVDELQMYTVPLAMLLYAFGWLFNAHRSFWEVVSLLVLLPPAALQTLGIEDQLRYSLLLGAWGLVLLLVGIVQPRRMMVVGGSIALLFAAFRQLWAVVSTLPTAAIIGLAGLLLIALAVTLTLTRERWMRRTAIDS